MYNKSEIASQIQSVVTGDLEGYLTEEEASQTYATQATVTALDGEVVKLSGNQTIKGTKTFGASPMLPVADPTNDRHAASKSYVDKAVQNATPNVGQLITTATAAQSTSSGETFGANITLHKISKTGSYNDLNNKPTIPSAPGTLITNATSAQTASSGEAMTGNITLHKVSKTGSYNDLNNKPTIPTVNNTLTSTSTSQALSANQGKVLNEKIPTVVSKLTNDAHYAKVEKADSETDALAKSKSNPDILYYWV